MSHVSAYRCDHCGKIVPSEDTVGINPVEDMFDRLASYPTVFTPVAMSKCLIHYCTTCYQDHVLTPAANLSNRRKDEHGYELKVRELSYGLRAETVRRVRETLRKAKEKRKR